MECQCAECAEYEGPNPAMMALRLSVFGAQAMVALTGMVKERSWKALGAWFAAIAFFLTLPRYLICCRCEGYGKKCYPLYLGRLTSMYLPKVEGKEVSPVGVGLELLTLNLMSNLPVIGLKNDKKLRNLYILLANLTMGLQFYHACRHCARYATDLRRDCLSARAARLVFSIERED
jgi:hypothetical protein